MTATATHDTKRGEDARARLMALTEIPGEWASAVARWKLLNAPHVVTNGDMRAPSVSAEYMLYQALLGAWPLEGPADDFVERIQAYALKAAREGKEQTSWLNPHEAYESGLRTFIAGILDQSEAAEFLESVATLARRLALLGALNSLSQLTLKATMPGVPDFYQGTELWDLALVDPDNRRPVDFAKRAALLEASRTPDWQRLASEWPSGHVKLAWTAHLLSLRTGLADVFTHGDYEPLEVSGPHRDHVVAFARRYRSEAAIIVAGRRLAPFTDHGRAWPRGEAFEGTVNIRGFAVNGIASDQTELPLSALFKDFPAAVLRANLTGAERRLEKRISV
jgi:(1->4)-alpha-D-glucan 1-alpha-D-glucosylmutase